MEKNIHLKNGIRSLGILMVACEFIGILIYKTLFKDEYFSFFPLLVCIFWILGSLTISILASNAENKANFLSIFLLTKVIKILVLAAVCVIYPLFVKTNLLSFYISVTLLFVVYTIFETCFSVKLNKNQ